MATRIHIHYHSHMYVNIQRQYHLPSKITIHISILYSASSHFILYTLMHTHILSHTRMHIRIIYQPINRLVKSTRTSP